MMMRELITSTRHYHDEYVRRHVRHQEPSERSRGDLRRAIGERLIHLGEMVAGTDHAAQFDEAA